jgi:LuxR family transcriptional regulator, quorum-sensing system regulator SdiA
MPYQSTIVKQVQEHLGGLGRLCDTGYLLAVHIRYTRPTLMFNTYPQDWLDAYSESGFMMLDPVVGWAMNEATAEGQMAWSDLRANDPAGVIAASAAHGLHNGVSCAIGPITSRTIGSITRTTAFSPADRDTAFAHVQAIHDLTQGLESMPGDVQAQLRAIGQ